MSANGNVTTVTTRNRQRIANKLGALGELAGTTTEETLVSKEDADKADAEAGITDPKAPVPDMPSATPANAAPATNDGAPKKTREEILASLDDTPKKEGEVELGKSPLTQKARFLYNGNNYGVKSAVAWFLLCARAIYQREQITSTQLEAIHSMDPSIPFGTQCSNDLGEKFGQCRNRVSGKKTAVFEFEETDEVKPDGRNKRKPTGALLGDKFSDGPLYRGSALVIIGEDGSVYTPVLCDECQSATIGTYRDQGVKLYPMTYEAALAKKAALETKKTDRDEVADARRAGVLKALGRAKVVHAPQRSFNPDRGRSTAWNGEQS